MTTPPHSLHWYDLPHAPPVGTVLAQRDALANGQPHMHSVFAQDDVAKAQPFRVLLLRSGADVTVFVNRCAHFGVPLAARQEQLIYKPFESLSCNVHYARYRWADGVCDRGDCEGESLVRVPVECDVLGTVRIADTGPAA
jgi:nitrite reductase/ring-hydroxylating ferredoxin subunit